MSCLKFDLLSRVYTFCTIQTARPVSLARCGSCSLMRRAAHGRAGAVPSWHATTGQCLSAPQEPHRLGNPGLWRCAPHCLVSFHREMSNAFGRVFGRSPLDAWKTNPRPAWANPLIKKGIRGSVNPVVSTTSERAPVKFAYLRNYNSGATVRNTQV